MNEPAASGDGARKYSLSPFPAGKMAEEQAEGVGK